MSTSFDWEGKDRYGIPLADERGVCRWNGDGILWERVPTP